MSAVYWGQGTKTSQLSAVRLIELFELTRRYSGILPALRMLLGVATGRSKPDSLLHRWAKIRKGTSSESAGLLSAADRNPNEHPKQVIEVPVVNMRPLPVRELTVEFSGVGGRVLPSPVYQTQAIEQGLWRVLATENVNPACALTVTLAASEGLARAERISWVAEC